VSTLLEIYDLETQLESGFVALFVAAGLEAGGPDSPAVFQDKRPRVEVVSFTDSGVAQDHFQPCPDGKYRHDFYKGTLTLAVITNPRTESGEQNVKHSTYRATVRAVMSSAYADLDMTNLKLRYMVPRGATNAIKTEEGHEVSNLMFELTFEIKPTSWPAAEP